VVKFRPIVEWESTRGGRTVEAIGYLECSILRNNSVASRDLRHKGGFFLWRWRRGDDGTWSMTRDSRCGFEASR
jgi:hypothetical protein